MKEQSLRVAMVVPSLRGGGLERVTSDLAAALAERGVVVAVFTTGGLGVHASRLSARGIVVHDCSEGRWRIRGYPARLVRALRNFAPDVVHAHSGTWFTARVASIVLRHSRLVFTEHGRYPPEPWRRRVVERWCARGTARIVAVSEATAAYLADFLRLPEKPRVIVNGVNLSDFGADPAARNAIRAEIGATSDELLVIAVGRLVPVKNHELLIRAVAMARGRGVSVRLAIAGTGPLQATLESLVGELGMNNYTHLLGFRTDVNRILSAGDVFALTSTTEGLPISLLEAMAVGLPVVASEVGGIPAALGNPPAGLLFPSGDADALCGGIERLASISNVRQALVAAGKTLLAQYDISAHADAYLNLYLSVYHDSRPDAREEAPSW